MTRFLTAAIAALLLVTFVPPAMAGSATGSLTDPIVVPPGHETAPATQQPRTVAPRATSDDCPVAWVNPHGAADHDRQVYIFVPAEAIRCLPTELVRCSMDCADWMRGLRGRPADREIATALREMARTGGRAYYLRGGVDRVNLPAGVEAFYCDTRVHSSQQVERMRVW